MGLQEKIDIMMEQLDKHLTVPAYMEERVRSDIARAFEMIDTVEEVRT